MRPVKITPRYTKYAAGSVLIEFGETKVICTASVEEKVPHFLKDKGEGWVTAEYSMLPSATHTRSNREASKGKLSGRTTEIQRLIGRSLRSVIDLEALGSRSIFIDADVIQADGGTRTASITGGMIALNMAVQQLLKDKIIKKNPIKEFLAAISVGICDGEIICDLCYEQDSSAEVDMNIVMTESGRLVEVQGTAEREPFSLEQLSSMLAESKKAIQQLISTIKNYN